MLKKGKMEPLVPIPTISMVQVGGIHIKNIWDFCSLSGRRFTILWHTYFSKTLHFFCIFHPRWDTKALCACSVGDTAHWGRRSTIITWFNGPKNSLLLLWRLIGEKSVRTSVCPPYCNVFHATKTKKNRHLTVLTAKPFLRSHTLDSLFVHFKIDGHLGGLPPAGRVASSIDREKFRGDKNSSKASTRRIFTMCFVFFVFFMFLNESCIVYGAFSTIVEEVSKVNKKNESDTVAWNPSSRVIYGCLVFDEASGLINIHGLRWPRPNLSIKMTQTISCDRASGRLG